SADAHAARNGGRSLVEGDGVAVDGQLHLVEALLCGLPRPIRAAEVELQQMRVRPAREHVEPTFHQRLGERVCIASDLSLVLAERAGRGDLEARSLRRDRVLEGTAL